MVRYLLPDSLQFCGKTPQVRPSEAQSRPTRGPLYQWTKTQPRRGRLAKTQQHIQNFGQRQKASFSSGTETFGGFFASRFFFRIPNRKCAGSQLRWVYPADPDSISTPPNPPGQNIHLWERPLPGLLIFDRHYFSPDGWKLSLLSLALFPHVPGGCNPY